MELDIAVAADSLVPQSHQNSMDLYLKEMEVSLPLYVTPEQDVMDMVHCEEEVGREEVVVGQDEIMMMVHWE